MEKRRRSLVGAAAAAAVAVAVALLATMPSPGAAASGYDGGGGGGGAAALSPDHYNTTCPHLEWIVRGEVSRKINETVVTIPAVLREFFHDCMVNGCDGSVLISSPQEDAEKDAKDNKSLAGDGFDTVNRVKAAVEQACPGVVSCADILALAARDVVYLAKGPYWEVELGRLDGLVSKAGDVDGKLPGPDMHIKELAAVFDKAGLSMLDMVALSGAHTVGFAHCTRFTKSRLYNYGGAGRTDPSYNPEYARELKQACPPDVGDTIAVNMDPETPIIFDNKYYSNLVSGLGLFTSDQVLQTDKASQATVAEFARNETAFFQAFVSSMIKLGRVGVKTRTGIDGEIRRVCTAFNHH